MKTKTKNAKETYAFESKLVPLLTAL